MYYSHEIKFFYFDKRKTDITKGIAILMMIWLHTFSSLNSLDNYTSIFTIGGYNIEYLLAKACNPVGLFMVLSGYGLYLSYQKTYEINTLTDNIKLTVNRLLRIYIPWWITLAFAVMVPSCLTEADFSLRGIFENITAWRTTWNHVGWYIMPFALISLLLNIIFPSFRKHAILWILFAFITYYGINIFYGTFWAYTDKYFALKIFCRLFEFLLPMLLGALAAKYRQLTFQTRIRQTKVSIFSTIGILLMFIISTYLGGIPVYPVYCIILILMIVNAKYTKYVDKTLAFLGQHSLNIWFIHAFLIRTVYQLKYSPIILLALVVISTLLSIGVNKISQPILTWINKK